MTHLEAEIPKRVEHPLGHRLDEPVDLVPVKEKKVHVGVGAQFAPPVAADRNDRHPVRHVRRRGAESPAGAVVENRQDRVHRVGEHAARLCPAAEALPLLLAHRDVGAGEELLQAVEEVPVGKVGPQEVSGKGWKRH